MDLLVSYSWGQFQRAYVEVRRILAHCGDDAPEVEKSHVPGIAIAHSRLDNRKVIQCCQKLRHESPGSFHFSIKWVPVDYWCHTDLASIKQCIDEQVVSKIGADQTWGMKVKKRCWQEYHTSEIVDYLAQDIGREVDLSDPHWWIWIDILGDKTAIALLHPDEIFSLELPYP